MHDDILTGVLLEDVALTLDELARACNVEPDWVVRHVHAGVLGGETSVQVTSWRFRSGDLVRARRLLSVERDFDANEDLAALVVDLGEEIRRLRARLRVLGVDPGIG
ncbi:chaperone modulator CbpM [Massilia pinisoli]|jgi:chaperone modulatory protein CbpM|uniref:Chaperone modulator CbpM n=1 Tax=Massilia pinisoli TaxID=1772194 RepID=A0ABT1ZVJ3_9BURK|nr:chaperone modulator CbpM [Massilia pinisoli]MCS0583900.1 chaperone modulator CbpM [Massilia pinisoli]